MDNCLSTKVSNDLKTAFVDFATTQVNEASLAQLRIMTGNVGLQVFPPGSWQDSPHRSIKPTVLGHDKDYAVNVP